MTTQQHREASETYLAQARHELSEGDLVQASEKGWVATAQIIKAIAEKRGWEHTRHRHFNVTISRLRAETGDGELRTLFSVAAGLHENFYENCLQPVEVSDGLDDVGILMDKLLLILDRA